MYAARITGVIPEPYYIGDGDEERAVAEDVAKKLANPTQDRGPRDILVGEDMVAFAGVLKSAWARTSSWARTSGLESSG